MFSTILNEFKGWAVTWNFFGSGRYICKMSIVTESNRKNYNAGGIIMQKSFSCSLPQVILMVSKKSDDSEPVRRAFR